MATKKQPPEPVVAPATAKTVTQRVQELRERRAAAGLAEVRGAFAHPDDHPAIKEFAAKTVRKRERAAKGKP